MRRRFLAALCTAAAATVVSACSGGESAPAVERTDSAATAAPASSPAPVQADFVGVWAATPADCGGSGAWRITADRLAAAGGVNCTIEGAARSTAGWAIQARCAAAGAPQPASLQFSAPTAEGGMTVSGGPFTPAAPLVRCTPPLTAPAP